MYTACWLSLHLYGGVRHGANVCGCCTGAVSSSSFSIVSSRSIPSSSLLCYAEAIESPLRAADFEDCGPWATACTKAWPSELSVAGASCREEIAAPPKDSHIAAI